MARRTLYVEGSQSFSYIKNSCVGRRNCVW